eukprot:scaffold110205_cov42-Phaeocystis_antarctica.AAC.2
MQVDVDERAYRVHRRLSGAALRALLAATPHDSMLRVPLWQGPSLPPAPPRVPHCAHCSPPRRTLPRWKK